ncbi:hypothetical protein L226DRAFT_535348 [Lentinus tigrinus ALCF2SS1-7]|uniref:BOD1/SHG1 domain-containing protein n=1 Tax=Lentinus tigrinus ALCF2SS1-6 TaxID=1328759 RepID=A0A5C2SE32_9APHY|nr:hypothetical protein L227DRAFT_652131 [Lentinus tigrinus ALCF2SS1-6]RPD74469.1 hypothetical protein L226DRAFT_535348 [Lentinus tigrinus ALCF2SS1-7]
MSITNPTQLVEEFKKSGEFDRLRRELLKEFRQSEGVAAFLARVDDIAKEKLASDPKLQYMPEANVSREIMQELDRYPIVERAVQDVRLLKDPSFVTGMKESMRNILLEDRKASGQATTNGNTINGTQGQNGNDSDSDGSEESMDMDIEEYSSD